jgi:DNA-binding protein HU-beta
MNKYELIDALAAETGVSKVTAKKVLESAMKNIGETLQNGKKVTLNGFGSWSVAIRAARQGRNPKTGDSIKIAAKSFVKFKPSSKLI